MACTASLNLALPTGAAPLPRAARSLRGVAVPRRAAGPSAAGPRARSLMQTRASISAEPSLLSRLGTGLAALSLAVTLQTCAPAPALASELDVLTTPAPTAGYVVDDAGLLSRATAGEINGLAKSIEDSTGYRVTVVTLRKLQFETDAFAFADKVIEKWYPSAALGDKKAVLLIVKASKEGALVAGPQLNKALGSALVDSITGENIPVFAEQEKFSEALTSSLKRMQAKLTGAADPGAPGVEQRKTGSNFKSKEETEDKRGIYGVVVGGLLVISFVVPMVQYYGYVGKRDE